MARSKRRGSRRRGSRRRGGMNSLLRKLLPLLPQNHSGLILGLSEEEKEEKIEKIEKEKKALVMEINLIKGQLKELVPNFFIGRPSIETLFPPRAGGNAYKLYLAIVMSDTELQKLKVYESTLKGTELHDDTDDDTDFINKRIKLIHTMIRNIESRHLVDKKTKEDIANIICNDSPIDDRQVYWYY